VVVDCSGDAVVAASVGARLQEDAPDRRQPASLLFKVGGVDFAALLAYAAEHSEDLRAGSTVPDPGSDYVNLWGFGRVLSRGYTDGEISLRRHEMHLAGWPRRGDAVINLTRVPAGEPTRNWHGTAYSRLSRQVLELAQWFRRAVPGCAHAYVAATADRVGVRESRRVLGRYTVR
jgi:hypothetical protein